MKKKKYGQLNQLERDRIKAMLSVGHKQSEIAGVLNRNPGTISREIARNKLEKDGKNQKKGEYDSNLADKKAKTRRKFAKYQGKEINEDKKLRRFIIKHLELDWSPDEISGRMKLKKKPFYASKNTIYKWLYSVWGQKYCKHLKSKRYNPKKRKEKKIKKSLIPNRIGIEMRPEVINNNEEYGHCETDTIVSGKKTGSKKSLAVTYQRKAKYISIRKIPSLKPEDFNNALMDIQTTQKIFSFTYDNGIENRLHALLKVATYFCDPYSSWQKGGVENVNGMIRRYIPKGADISDYSNEYIQMIEYILNNKPRKSLGYKTPREVMIENNLLIRK